MLKHMLTTSGTTGTNGTVVGGRMPPGGSGGGQTTLVDNSTTMMMDTRNDLNTTGNSVHRYRNTSNLNSSTRIAGQISQHHQHQQPLNISTLNSSKHSIGGSSVSPGTQIPKISNGGLNISRINPVNLSTAIPLSSGTVIPRHSTSHISSITANHNGGTTLGNGGGKYPNISALHHRLNGGGGGGASATSVTGATSATLTNVGVKEMLVSLGLLCLVSLLLALLSLIFLLKISPVTANDIREILRAEQLLTVITAEEYVVVYEVTLTLCALTLSLNLCCLLVCAIQFLFAVKLVKSPHGGNDRTNKYLQKASISRVCAVAGFFISIPVFLTGIILYTFIQFHSTPAIVTSAFIGLGIVFCGCAMVHNVFIWQREKTNAVKAMALQHVQEQREAAAHAIASSTAIFPSQNISITNPNLLNSSTHMDYHSTYNNNVLQPPLNSSHISAHSAVGGSQYVAGVRPSTTTPPTPTSPGIGKLTVAVGGHYGGVGHLREASGSISPGVPLNTVNMGIDKNSIGTTNSPHELSTLV